MHDRIGGMYSRREQVKSRGMHEIIKFSLLNLDQGGKMNADPCESGSTALILFYLQFFLSYSDFVFYILKM